MKPDRHLTLALCFAIVYPTLLTLVYFQWLQGTQAFLQQATYGIGKLIQFGFPIAFVWFVQRERLRKSSLLSSPGASVTRSGLFTDQTKNNFLIGLIFGMAVVAAMLALYFQVIPATLTERVKTLVAEKTRSMGIDSTLKFLGLSCFYVVCHSFMEEYYWRWFVYDSLQQKGFSKLSANMISSLGFMAHHVVLLGFFFGWGSPMTYFLSLSVAAGGVFWAWLYDRQSGFRMAWFSHAIVDAGIFGLGIWLMGKA